MSAFTTIFKNDLKLFLKDWKAVILLMVMPVLFISLFAYTLKDYIKENSFIEPFDIAIVDKEDTTQSRMVIRQLEEVGIFKNILILQEDRAVSMLEDNHISAFITIPQDFTTSVSHGENRPIKVVGNANMPLHSFIVRNLVQSACNLVSAGQSAINAIYYYNKQAGVSGLELEQEYTESATRVVMEAMVRGKVFRNVQTPSGLNLTPFEYFTSSLLVIFLMFAGMPGVKMLVTERELGLFDRLRASAAKVWQIMASKFLVTLLLSSVQFITTFIITVSLFKNYWGSGYKNVIFMFSSVLFAVSCWSLLVSSISRTPKSADMIGNLGILLMAVIGGNIYPLTSMPGFVQFLSKLTINRWAMEGFMVIFSGNKALEVGGYALPILALGFCMLAIASTLYYWQLRGSGE